MKFAPIIYLIGMLLCILSLFMLIPALVDWFYGSRDWPAFIASSLSTPNKTSCPMCRESILNLN